MADAISIASLVLGGAQFAWEVGRSIWRSQRGSNRGRGDEPRQQITHIRQETRQQVTHVYSQAQLYVPPPLTFQHAGPRLTVFCPQRSADTYQDEDTGIQMGAGFNPRLVIPPETHWNNPLGNHGLGTVMVVDWTNRLAWAYVHVHGSYYLWYKVENVNTSFFLTTFATRYAIATVTMVDGCPVWSTVALEVMDGSATYNGAWQSTNDWMRLGISHVDLRPGEYVFVGMTRSLLMGILVGRYTYPTGLNVDTVLDDEGNVYINIDSDLRSNPVSQVLQILRTLHRHCRHPQRTCSKAGMEITNADIFIVPEILHASDAVSRPLQQSVSFHGPLNPHRTATKRKLRQLRRCIHCTTMTRPEPFPSNYFSSTTS